MISTISESFALRAKLTVLPLQDLIRIEGAGGHQIQYLGYVKSSVCLPELNKIFDVLFLVVPDTPYQVHGSWRCRVSQVRENMKPNQVL